MHIHLPKPLHGWREVVGEIAIIVVGVLIALVAEQLVESFHWRSEMSEFRDAADRELAYDVAAHHYRLQQGPCVARRIAELEHWRDDQRAGRGAPFAREIGRPSALIFRASVWAARSPEVMTHMPLEKRVAYSALYDRLESFQAQIVDERETWRSLAAFNGAPKISAEDAMRLAELLFRAESIDKVMRSSEMQISDDVRLLGIRPRFDSGHVSAPDAEFCKPLFERRT